MKELELAVQKLKENKLFFKRMSRQQQKKLDSVAFEAHEEAFREIDCLDCANCCKTTGPLFTKPDIDRLSKLFKMKSSAFIDNYLIIDEDEDYILKTKPCPFLLEDNKCMVYEHRPKACKEFPHTDRKNFYQIRNHTLKNTLICPIAFRVVESIKKNIGSS